MNRIASSAGSLLLAGAATLAQAHGSVDTPVAPADFTAAAIVHRLKQMGYTEVRVVRDGPESVDVALVRGGKPFSLNASKHLVGPGSLAVQDAAQVVERSIKPLASPTNPNGSGTVTPPTIVTPSTVIR